MDERIKVLRSVLDLEPYDDILPTDDPEVFFVERKKTRGVYGFTGAMGGDSMDVYLVVTAIEASSRDIPLSEAVHAKDQYYVFQL